MGKKRRQFTKEYKIEAVRLVIEEGRRISEVARELGIAEALLGSWKKKHEEGKAEPLPGKGRLSPEDDELRRLRRENERLRMERDISLKVELIHGKLYTTRQEAKTAIFDYIEVFYNRERRHSYLGYLSPIDFEKQNAA